MTTAAKNSPDLSLFHDISVRIEIELGQGEISVESLLELARGSVFALARSVENPVDISVNRRRVAHGEIVTTEEGVGVRITEILAPVAGARR